MITNWSEIIQAIELAWADKNRWQQVTEVSGVRCDLPGKVAGLSRRISPMPAGEGESERGSSPRNTATKTLGG